MQGNDIAIVGMSLCVPGADSVARFWDNLRDGVESIEVLDKDALLAAGERADLINYENYVPSAARLKGFDEFDAEFFGFSPKEAAILDPQHRKFLEVAWEAMENAGHPPETVEGSVGVYAGCGMGSYFYFNICSNPALVDDVGMFLLRHTGNDKDFLTTRVSHVFDLKGPSVGLQTACSTSLVAVHFACEALRNRECAMALAGGVTIELPQGRGYLFKENEILSPDGHCHAFDHRAQGTVFGSGAGAVALKRLDDAQADGDHIWAVIKGSAINNDGAAKAGYLAPSVDGQATAISKALKVAGVTADTIDYVECHGTGTYLGDPIEVSALSEAFGETTTDIGYCGIGSVKTNIGHLDTAAGVAGLVKTALGLHHRQIPPSLGYEAPNPAIDFETSPFRVNDTLRAWTSHKGPRRAGVNALGVGGTNAHTVLQEAPDRGPSEESDFPFHVLCLSGRSKAALDGNTAALAAHLRANPELSLADVAYTLKQGRRGFDKRRVVVAETALQAAELLEAGDTRRVFSHDSLGVAPEVVFMFPGGGVQFTTMAQDLYETEPVFAEWMDRGLDHLAPQFDVDLRGLWLPEPGDREAAEEQLGKPSVQLPLIMLVEYALAQLWISWGVQPAALVGHSMGENTAACLAGVMRFEDCVDLVALRGRLFETVPSSGMLSVSLAVEDVREMIGDDLDIAALNAPGMTTIAGSHAALDALAEQLATRDIDHQRIAIDIASHSRMLEPVLGKFAAFLHGLTLSPPQIPIMSNRSGAVLSDAQATDPDYWVQQLRQTVLFGDCITTLAKGHARVFLEVGPGKTLSSLAQMNPDVAPNQVLSTLRHKDQDIGDDAYFLGVIGRLWATGVEADWAQIWGEARRYRLPLPTYAFQRSRYFIEPGTQAIAPVDPVLTRVEGLENWGYRPVWKPVYADCPADIGAELDGLAPQNWLIFLDDTGVGAQVCERLERAGQTVTRVSAGDAYVRLSEGRYAVAPEQGREGYEALLRDLAGDGRSPTQIAHFWLLTGAETARAGSNFHDRNLERGFYSLMALSQALAGDDMPDPVHMTFVTNGAAQVGTEALPYPEKSMIAGAAGVIAHEVPGLSIATLDLEMPAQKPRGLHWPRLRATPDQSDRQVTHVLEELLASPANGIAAWRDGRRLEKGYRSAPLKSDFDTPAFRQGGTYLITGGFGGIGLSVAADLLTRYGANVILLARDPLPDRDLWAEYLRTHSAEDRIAKRLRALAALEGLGGSVQVAVGDITNIEQMRAAKARATLRFGPITGVIHAAGTIGDGPVLSKTLADTEAVFAPKIAGLRVLETLFPDGELELLVLFSSTSTALRPAGQVDYVAANEYLNAYAASRRDGATRVCAINWGIWADTGMAAEAMDRRLGKRAPEQRDPARAPLLDEAGFDAMGNRVFFTSLSTQEHWVLNQHRTADGTALLPGTAMIELVAEALGEHGVSDAFDIRDLYFFRPLQVDDHATRDMVVRLEPTPEGYGFSLYSALAQGGYQMNAQAQVTLISHAVMPDPIDIAAIEARCADTAQSTPLARLKSPQEAHLNFGPRWHVLQTTALGTGEGLAHLTLPDAARGDPEDGYLLHPGLLDLATGWAMKLIAGYGANHLWVPVSYGAIRVLAPLGAQIVSWVRLDDRATPADGFATFDITLCDAAGQVCVEITGFQMKRTAQGLDLDAPLSADAQAVDLGLAPASVQPLSQAERQLHHNITQGVRAEEGPEAMHRALGLGLAQVVVSSLDLEGLMAQANRPATLIEKGQSFERPDLETAFEAPETDIEKTIAGLFESLLGVSQVGVNDSFFDLGGHSLIAVRLFARIKQAYDVQFPISVLFEAPSVAKCAALIAERTGGRIGGDTTSESDGAVPPKGPVLRHLVALHQGDTGQKKPFFVVAGMGGNVLNLRHLALMLGRDRPVYGFQARGLIGDDEPHRTMETAAADYIAEMRSVQAHGPYFLGGYSGGGITAYEMARQLEADGEVVSVLAMLDTPLPVRPGLSRRDKLAIKIEEFRRKGLGYFGEWARNRLQWELQRRKPVQGDTSDLADFNNRKIEAAFNEAAAAYQLKPWSGPLTLFRPPLDRQWQVSQGAWVNGERAYVLEDNGWTGWVAQMQTIEVPGDHFDMVLVPNISVLAAHLKETLEQAETPADPVCDAPLGCLHTAAE